MEAEVGRRERNERGEGEGRRGWERTRNQAPTRTWRDRCEGRTRSIGWKSSMGWWWNDRKRRKTERTPDGRAEKAEAKRSVLEPSLRAERRTTWARGAFGKRHRQQGNTTIVALANGSTRDGATDAACGRSPEEDKRFETALAEVTEETGQTRCANDARRPVRSRRSKPRTGTRRKKERKKERMRATGRPLRTGTVEEHERLTCPFVVLSDAVPTVDASDVRADGKKSPRKYRERMPRR